MITKTIKHKQKITDNGFSNMWTLTFGTKEQHHDILIRTANKKTLQLYSGTFRLSRSY